MPTPTNNSTTPARPQGRRQFVLTPDLSFLPSGFEPWFKDDFSSAFCSTISRSAGTSRKSSRSMRRTTSSRTQMNGMVSDQATGLAVTAIEDAPVMVEISDTSSRTQYQNQAVRIGTLCGTGEPACVLGSPRLDLPAGVVDQGHVDEPRSGQRLPR